MKETNHRQCRAGLEGYVCVLGQGGSGVTLFLQVDSGQSNDAFLGGSRTAKMSQCLSKWVLEDA